MQLIACDSHTPHLVSKAGSVIGSKSLSPVFNEEAVNTQSCKFTDKLRNITFIIKCYSSVILNVILPSLSVN